MDWPVYKLKNTKGKTVQIQSFAFTLRRWLFYLVQQFTCYQSTILYSNKTHFKTDLTDDRSTEYKIIIENNKIRKTFIIYFQIYESLRSHLSNCVVEERLPTPPPTYDALFKPPPTYEDALKEIKQETSSSTVSKKTAAPEPEVYIIR